MRRTSQVLTGSSLFFGLALVFSAAAPLSFAQEVKYVEDFALAQDREAALAQLIPGTNSHFYYHALHAQNLQQFDRVESILAQWEKSKRRDSSRITEIRHRQALLTYNKNPEKSLIYLRKTLALRFDHERDSAEKTSRIPTQLDPSLIDWKKLVQNSIRRRRDLGDLKEIAITKLLDIKLDPATRRYVLRRVKRPDHPKLVDLVIGDLRSGGSRGFGTIPIHSRLLLSQLEACLQQQPALLNETRFVQAYLTKLQPSEDVDRNHEKEEYKDYLDRLWTFAKRLSQVHNSLKAHVLYHRLTFDLSQGVFHKQRFMSYLRIPRRVSYMNPKYLNQYDHQRHPANLSTRFSSTGLKHIGNDESLVRKYLSHFFVTETSTEPYAPFVGDNYLRRLFAETKILHGLGDDQDWAAMLDPNTYKALRERVELTFAPTNPRTYGAKDPVAFDLDIKNVKTLIVKVFEINAWNYYRQTGKPMTTQIELDGLVPGHEETHTYEESPFRRVRRHFDFPMLSAPGIYVVDFIGGGQSSRVLVQKGRLRHLSRTGPAGHVITVFDEEDRVVQGARAWIGNREFRANEKGDLLIPFSTSPQKTTIVLTDGEICSVEPFEHASENYKLTASFGIDRESLLAGNVAQILVRPMLRLNQNPITLSVLKKPRLVITARNHEGITTTQEVPDFKLYEDRESTHEFLVPPRLAEISFALRAEVENRSQGKTNPLSSSRRIRTNGIDRTALTEDLHLTHHKDGYTVEVLGRNGEPRPDRPVRFLLRHHYVNTPVDVTLRSDTEGQITLGPLTDIQQIIANPPAGRRTQRIWTLSRNRHSQLPVIHALEGELIEIPYMIQANSRSSRPISLLEKRGGTFAFDHSATCVVQPSSLQISGLPRGEHSLFVENADLQVLRIQITRGQRRQGHLFTPHKILDQKPLKTLQIQPITVGKDTITIQLSGANPFTRVHLLATRYLPTYPIYKSMVKIRDNSPGQSQTPILDSYHVEGRKIGDEMRYILERKYATRYPGNLLARPGLILNPWALRSTDTDEENLSEGGRHGGAGGRFGGKSTYSMRGSGTGTLPTDYSNLDFLAQGSKLLFNLAPDETGRIQIERTALGNRSLLRVVALDTLTTCVRSVTLPQQKISLTDLRLSRGLDPKSRFTQQQKRTVLRENENLILADMTTARYEVYDSLERVFDLYRSLSKNPTLDEFRFLLDWPTLTPEKKRELYSKYASHEMNFFLFKKDPSFFQNVVQPHLAHKKDKTFLDRWFLKEDLTSFLKPWNYNRLNVVERILLSRRINGESKPTARHLDDLFALLPPDASRSAAIFSTAIQGRSLDAASSRKYAPHPAKAPSQGEEKGRPSDKRSRKMLVEKGTAIEADSNDAAEEEPMANSRGRSFGSKGTHTAIGRGGAPRNQREKELLQGEFKKSKNRGFFSKDKGLIAQAKTLYRSLEPTREWVENNYYHRPIEEQNASLVTVNRFWKELARHDLATPFYSTHLAESHRNFTEMMFALSFLDLPLKAKGATQTREGQKLTLAAQSPLVVFHREISPTTQSPADSSVLVSQNFYRHGSRYHYVDGRKVDHYVTEEFLIHTVYGCHVVVTNPTSTAQRLEVLLQVPVGSIPVNGVQFTRSIPVDLAPYRTQTFDLLFYFPQAGRFTHYPVHVARGEQIVANAPAVELVVVDQPSKIDTRSWAHVAQSGTTEEVLDYLNTHNLHRIDFSRILFRMKNREVFLAVTDLLQKRHIYNHDLWAYALHHAHVPAINEYLEHRDPFVANSGESLRSPLLAIDPVHRRTYQHIDYHPLVNARAHQVGKRRTILNQRLNQQYHFLLKTLSYRRELDSVDRLAVVTYLLLQDRVQEAIDHFGLIDRKEIAAKMQYDYCAAYLSFYTENLDNARAIATRYREYPVDRWRNAFEAITAQLDEIDGKDPRVVDPDKRDQTQTDLAASQSTFDFTVESKQIHLEYQNLKKVQIRYYLMDVELLFSRNPFVQKHSARFAHIMPNATQSLELPDKSNKLTTALPEAFHNRNVLVEISADGKTRSQAYFANSISVNFSEDYGQLQVRHTDTGKALSKVYVKVFGRSSGGTVRFYKDGYTDLRGRFDYASLSGDETGGVDRFSVLILSDEHGATVREATPPAR